MTDAATPRSVALQERHETIRHGARSEGFQTELPMLKFLGGTIGFIFLVGLVVVVGILMLIF
jgi:hypothetical protein